MTVCRRGRVSRSARRGAKEQGIASRHGDREEEEQGGGRLHRVRLAHFKPNGSLSMMGS